MAAIIMVFFFIILLTPCIASFFSLYVYKTASLPPSSSAAILQHIPVYGADTQLSTAGISN